MYIVLKHFTDLKDKNFEYHAGDEYPRNGLKVSPSRIKELSGSNNKRGIPLIKEIPELKESYKRTSSAKKADE